MRFKDLLQKTPDELRLMEQELVLKIREMKFGVASRQLKQVHQVAAAKRDLARVKTRLRNMTSFSSSV